MINDVYKRICRKCNNIIYYKSIGGYKFAIKNNSDCFKCKITEFNKKTKKGKKLSENIKKKMSESQQKIGYCGKKNHFYGKNHSEISRIKMSKSQLGRKHTEESKEKMRMARINRIKELGCSKMYNPKACKYIDILNIIYGINLQHAKNGGEIVIAGYSLDGYDKEKNVVFEYDERRHYNINGELKETDIVRQNRIIKKISPLLFIRYNEVKNKIYDIITNTNMQIII